ncbi:MAG: hypothetical protein ABT15_01430 [Pseudonocardia sp. SCN 73-27]|nr:MAG: hypothetical protein ABS80_04040 [Pseudonocardia sp. SCN 72-51]ODV08930.1 MAG: hypothetical protein ABT15_01430 [Pseudonocardia sp. SCN 73-27]
MARSHAAADGRDDKAADRDDTADRRDDSARGRDDTAIRRDSDAAARDTLANRRLHDLTDDLRDAREQIIGGFARVENTTIDPLNWPDLPLSTLARLQAYVADQRQLAGRARESVTVLFDRLSADLHEARVNRLEAAADRLASSGDRNRSAGDRLDSGRDRSASAADREQSAIEREQVDPRDLPPDHGGGRDPDSREHPGRTSSLPTEQTLDTSRRRILDSRDRIERARHPGTPSPSTDVPPQEVQD